MDVIDSTPNSTGYDCDISYLELQLEPIAKDWWEVANEVNVDVNNCNVIRCSNCVKRPFAIHKQEALRTQCVSKRP